MDKKITGVVDIPLKMQDKDRLQIESFEKALNQFIQKTSTPISIALQGEWGSGKTSLMNRLDYSICQAEKATSYGIWLNTWHYALLKNKEDILESIINALLNEVVRISKQEYPEKFKTLVKEIYSIGKTVFKGLSKVAVKTAISQINSDAADAIDEAVFTDGKEKTYNLNDLKNKLSQLIFQLIEKNTETGNQHESFIFFIDDLDRIEPALAVNILELLKNIFDIEHCIFILAIDYDVVVKGLKNKFGELNQKNEREFRSFFDKIIQLPFQMPVNSYNISKYISELLNSVDFISNEEAEDTDFIQTLVRFASFTIGTNPRSIKRLVNTLSFVHLLLNSKPKEKNETQTISSFYKQIIFALTSLQIGFPTVFNLLSDNPNIENWTDEFASKYSINLQNTENISLLSTSNKWEQILFFFSQKNEFLKRNSFNIIALVKEMQLLAEQNEYKLHQILPEIIALLSVTNIKAEIKPKIDINNIRVLYAINLRLLPALEKKLVEPLKFVQRKGRMIAKVSYQFDENKNNNSLSVAVFVKHNNIYLTIGGAIGLFSINKTAQTAWQYIEERGKTEVFNQIVADFKSLERKYNNLKLANTVKNSLSLKKGKLYLEQKFLLVCESVDYLYSTATIDEISSFSIDYMLLLYRIKGTNWESK